MSLAHSVAEQEEELEGTNHRNPAFVTSSGRSHVIFLTKANSHKLIPVVWGDDAVESRGKWLSRGGEATEVAISCWGTVGHRQSGKAWPCDFNNLENSVLFSWFLPGVTFFFEF